MFNPLKYKKLASVILIVNFLFIVGCGASVQKTTYVSLATAANLVNTARQTYDDLYQAGKVSQEFDDKVAVAYKKYQLGMNSALSAFKTYKMLADAGGKPDPTTVNALIVETGKLIADLFELFTKTGVPTGAVALEPVK